MKTQRIRDPIHDIIVFDDSGIIDQSAWELIRSNEFQRLRRVKQLGVSEFIFPSATHTRFAHSIGVFNNARRLIELIHREIKAKRVEGNFDLDRAKITLFASLLHDIGHGPFSHAFEEARKSIAATRGKGAKIRKHEAFTADMIENKQSTIAQVISASGVDPAAVAQLIRAETPTDMYHAVVSSSFDADRLDYLMRDRHMTGTGAGAIDLGWLLDNVRVAMIDFSPPESEAAEPIYQHSFCLGHKARDAAEDFLLARYRLYTNVYFHKATRGIEQLVSHLFKLMASELADKGRIDGLRADHPLTLFFSDGGETVHNYLQLDDTVVWGAIHDLAVSGTGDTRTTARRLLTRDRPLCLDIQHEFPDDPERQRRLIHRLNSVFAGEIGQSVFRDSMKLSLYGPIGADDERAQKRLMILKPDNELTEITDFRDATIVASSRERSFERYYFLNEKDATKASNETDSLRGRRR